MTTRAPGAGSSTIFPSCSGSRTSTSSCLCEDSLARLDVFKAQIPNVFANQVRLEHLDREAARSAILGPLERWNELTAESVEIQPELVEAVLDDVTRDPDRIEAPYLQLVLERIWNAERAEDSHVLRLETLLGLGGAATIVRDHLRDARVARRRRAGRGGKHVRYLRTPSGTKIAHRAPDLAVYADVPEDALRRVLSKLTRERIVHSVDASDRFEIFHDVLAEPIRDWRLHRRIERERLVARRRQRLVPCRLAQRRSSHSRSSPASPCGRCPNAVGAQRQARHARARELRGDGAPAVAC